jgi:mannitol/fructose-specific phosphotransferase system IIA component (Ntr-type)
VVLSQLLTPATMVLHLHAGQRDAIFVELINRIPDLAQKPEGRQRLLRALQEREQLHSTGIGDGVAIPHARHAIAGLADHPIIVFGRHLPGIAYGAIDGAPVQLFFLLLAPSVSQHLQTLARLTRLLRDAALRKALLAAEKPETVLAVIREAEGKG